jgi:hypothetical protein
MDSSRAEASFDLRCLLDNVQGMVDALTCLRWKKQQVITRNYSSNFCLCYTHLGIRMQ